MNIELNEERAPKMGPKYNLSVFTKMAVMMLTKFK
jgi:hypothetical protein